MSCAKRGFLVVSSCSERTVNAVTGSAAVDLPWEMKVHTTSPMQLKVVSDVARGGGGCIPAEMPCRFKACAS